MTQPDTRHRIQQVALRLFNENGYEATALREIADEVGVTKAALYYYFKTKEEIVTSLIDDRVARLDELHDWAHTLPRNLDGRRAFLTRYADELYTEDNEEIMRFAQRNPTALRDHPANERMRQQMLGLVDFLTEADATPAARLKASMALFALHGAIFVLREHNMTDEERKATGLQVALELLG